MTSSIGEWRVTGVLGHGSQGTVYEASDAAGLRAAAVKVLTDRARVERFFDEATAAASIEHPGVVRIWGHGVDAEGRAFIAMERLRGETLHERMRNRPLSPGEVVGVVRQLASALAAAHARGVVHRDVKPENVFLEGERVVLVDFGIARLGSSRSGTLTGSGPFGTPPYMSPEQCRGEAVDARSDLYSLGCVLYEMVSGTPPFGFGDVLEAHRTCEPAPLREAVEDMPPALDALASALLAKEPGQRPPSGAAVLAALDAAALTGSPLAPLQGRFATVVPPPSRGWRSRAWARFLEVPPWSVGGIACVVGWVMLGASIAMGVGNDYLASPNWGFTYLVLVPLVLMLMSSSARRCHEVLGTQRLGEWLVGLFAVFAPLSVAGTVVELARRAPLHGQWWSDAPVLGVAAAVVQGTFGALILVFIVHAVGWAHLARERGVEPPAEPLGQMLAAGAGVQVILYLANVQYVAHVRVASIASVMLPFGSLLGVEAGRYQSVITLVSSAMVAGFMIIALVELKRAGPAAVAGVVALVGAIVAPPLGPPLFLVACALAAVRAMRAAGVTSQSS